MASDPVDIFLLPEKFHSNFFCEVFSVLASTLPQPSFSALLLVVYAFHGPCLTYMPQSLTLL